MGRHNLSLIDIFKLKYIISKNKSPIKDMEAGNEATEESSSNPIALLQPIAPNEEEWQDTDYADGKLRQQISPFIFQTHATTIFHHKIQLENIELSEIKEETVVTNQDSANTIDIHSKRLILLHTRKMGQMELIIKTVSSENNELIDHDTKGYVTVGSINGEHNVRRLMSRDELKIFRRDWLKLWRPKFTDQEATRYALMEEAPPLPIQPAQESDPFVLREADENNAYSPAPTYQKKKPGIVRAPMVPNTSRNVSKTSKGGSLTTKTSKAGDGQEKLNESGWETYVEPGYEANE